MTNRYRGTELLRTVVIVLAMTMISALPSRAFFNYDFWIGQDFRTSIYSTGTHGQVEISGESGDANSPKRGLHTIGAVFNELMRSTIVTLAAITLVIALTTAWSMSMLPRLRDVVATIQTPP